MDKLNFHCFTLQFRQPTRKVCLNDHYWDAFEFITIFSVESVLSFEFIIIFSVKSVVCTKESGGELISNH